MDVFSSFSGQCSVKAAWATRSPWSISEFIFPFLNHNNSRYHWTCIIEQSASALAARDFTPGRDHLCNCTQITNNNNNSNLRQLCDQFSIQVRIIIDRKMTAGAASFHNLTLVLQRQGLIAGHVWAD